MDCQAARLFVGAQFDSRDDLDAVVERWATTHSTRLARCPGHTGKLRWTCASWVHPGLACKYRDCIVEVEAAYSSDCGYWRVEALTTQHMSEAQWNEWSSLYLQTPAKDARTRQSDSQSTRSPNLLDNVSTCLADGSASTDGGFVAEQGSSKSASHVSLSRNSSGHPQAPLPQPTSPDFPRKPNASISSQSSPATTVILQSECLTHDLPSKDNKMAISSLCHPHDQTPSPVRNSQASASAASPRRPQRIPNVIKADLEKIARARRLAAQASAEKLSVEIAAAEAAALAAAQLAEEERLEEERAALIQAAEQRDIEEKAAENTAAEERDALAILASQAAHQLDEKDVLESATIDESSDLSTISNEIPPLAIEHHETTPSEQAEHHASPSVTDDMTSLSFRTAEGFIEWANECLEFSHEMSTSTKRGPGQPRNLTVACQNGRKLSCPWKIKATKRRLAGSSIRWEVVADIQEHSKACMDVMDASLLKKYKTLLAPKATPKPTRKQPRRQFFGKPKVNMKGQAESGASPEGSLDGSEHRELPSNNNGTLALPPAETASRDQSCYAVSKQSVKQTEPPDRETSPRKILGVESPSDNPSQTSLESAESKVEGDSGSDGTMAGTVRSDSACPENEETTNIAPPEDAALTRDNDLPISMLAEANQAPSEAIPQEETIDPADSVHTELNVPGFSMDEDEISNAPLTEVNLHLSSLHIGQSSPHHNLLSSPKSHHSTHLASDSNTHEHWPSVGNAPSVGHGDPADFNMLGLDEDHSCLRCQDDLGNFGDTASDVDARAETTPDLITSMGSNQQPSPTSSLTALPSEDELLTPGSGNETEAFAAIRSIKDKRSRVRPSKSGRNPSGLLEEAHPVRRSRRVSTASASFDKPDIQSPRPALSQSVTEEESNKAESDEDSDSTPKIVPSRNRSISTNPSISRKRKKETAKSSKSKRKKFIFGAFDNLDDFIDSEKSRRGVFGGDSDEEDQKVPVVQACARSLTRDPNHGGKYMVVDSGDEEESDIEVECISSEDEDMQDEESRSNASRAGSHVDSVKAPSSEHDELSNDNAKDNAVAPESDGVQSASHDISRTIVDDQASEADPAIQGDPSDNKSIDPAVSMPSAAKTGVENEEDLAIKTEEEEEDLPTIAETSDTIMNKAIPSSATLDDDDPFFIATSVRYQSHPPPDIDQQSHMARSPTLPRGFQQALQEIEDDLNSQQEERYMSRAPRFGDFPSESP